jgi:hypothetical protein
MGLGSDCAENLLNGSVWPLISGEGSRPGCSSYSLSEKVAWVSGILLKLIAGWGTRDDAV